MIGGKSVDKINFDKLNEVNLKNLAWRVDMDKRMLSTAHSDNIELLERHIKKQEELIIQCVMANLNNPLLEQIKMD